MANDKFAFKLSNDGGKYKNYIIERLTKRFPWLTIDGIDEPKTYSGVQYAGPDSVLTFGTSKYHNVSWSDLSLDKIKDKGIAIYSLNTWGLFLDRLENYAKNNHPLYFLCDKEGEDKLGYDYKLNDQPVKIYDNFIQIGSDIIPRKQFMKKPEPKTTFIMSVLMKTYSSL